MLNLRENRGVVADKNVTACVSQKVSDGRRGVVGATYE